MSFCNRNINSVEVFMNNQRLEFCAGGLGRFLYFIEIFSVSTISQVRSAQPVFSSHFVRILPSRYRVDIYTGAELVLMSRTIVARPPSICLSAMMNSFGSSSSKLQLMASPAPVSSGTSLTCASLIRSWIISSVISGRSPDAEADPPCLLSPCEEGGPQPNESASSNAIPKNDKRENVERGTFGKWQVVRGKNAYLNIRVGLVTRIADLHTSYVQACEKYYDGCK